MKVNLDKLYGDLIARDEAKKLAEANARAEARKREQERIEKESARIKTVLENYAQRKEDEAKAKSDAEAKRKAEIEVAKIYAEERKKNCLPTLKEEENRQALQGAPQGFRDNGLLTSKGNSII